MLIRYASMCVKKKRNGKTNPLCSCNNNEIKETYVLSFDTTCEITFSLSNVLHLLEGSLEFLINHAVRVNINKN